MPNEIATQNQFLGELQRAILSNETTPEKMMQLLDVQERILNKNAEAEFNIAMSELQAKLPIIGKDKKTDKSKYASYEAIMEILASLLAEFGFSVTFKTETLDNKIIINGKITHRAGHSESVSIPLPLDTSGSKNAVQSVGSTLSYGKRYALSLLVNFATKDEDDDARSAVKTRVDTISEEQELKLQEYIAGTNTDERKFLLAYKVNALHEMDLKQYEHAIAVLKKKEGKNV